MAARAGRLRSRLGWLVLLPVLVACSADAVTEPEATVGTPGAFVAWVDRSDESIRLFRTVGTSAFTSDDVLLLGILYAERPQSFEHARELARMPDLREQVHQYFMAQNQLLSQPHEVVWFRTLTSADISPAR
jgi:hypothetical protein